MTTDPKTTNWPARRAAIVAANDDEWDRLSDAYETDWKAAYTAEFVRFAVSRNWSRENAEVWSSEIADEALNEARGSDADPVNVAQSDVAECEWETANAC